MHVFIKGVKMQIHKNILVRVDKEDLDKDGLFVVPEETKEIASSAFMFCNEDLNKIVISEGVDTIEAFTFYGCENLREVEIPSSMREIGDLAFFDCFNLCAVEFPEGIERIGKGVFTTCVNLETVILPESVKKIGSDLFYGCESLKQLAIPKRFERELDEILGPSVVSNNIEVLLTEPESANQKQVENQ